MNMDILRKLENTLYKKYKSLQYGFMFIEVYEGIIVLNWSPINDNYINYKRVEQIKKFMFNFLIKNRQEGFFYVGDSAIKLGRLK